MKPSDSVQPFNFWDFFCWIFPLLLIIGLWVYFGSLAELPYFFLMVVWPRFLHIILTPYYHPAMIWTILPLLASTILMTIYFGRWKTEELGWNTAYGNTIALFFVIASMIQELLLRYDYHSFFDFSKPVFILFGQPLYQLIFLVILMLEAVALIYFNYNHYLSKRFMFLVSSTIPVNGTALACILVIEGDVLIDKITLLTILLFLYMFWAVFAILRYEVKPARGVKSAITRHQHLVENARKRLFLHIQKKINRIGKIKRFAE